MIKYRPLWFILIYAVNAFGQFNLYRELEITAPTEKVACLQISDDGRFLAYGCNEGDVFLYDLNARRELHRLAIHDKRVNGVIFDSKNRLLVSASDDGRISIWDLYSGRLERSLEDFKSRIKVIDLSPDDKVLAACGDNNEIPIWEFPLGSLRGRLKGHKADVVSLSFNQNGDQILSLDKDRKMILWDVGRQQPLRSSELSSQTLKNSGLDVVSAGFSSDKYFMAAGLQEHVLAKSGKGMIFKYHLGFYDWKSGSEISILEGNNRDIRFFSLSPDKKYAVTDNSTLHQNQISFWNIQKGIVEQNVTIPGEITAISLSKNGAWLAVASVSGGNHPESGIHVWRVSGIDGYRRFGEDQEVKSLRPAGFGSAMKLTTSGEPLIQFGKRKRVAVMYFDGPGLTEETAKTTSYLLEGRLGNSPFVELIERNQINSVISELKYQMTGLTASDAVKIGEQLNAEYILIGSINKLGNLLIITAKLVNIETSQIEGIREVQCSNAVIEDISEMVALLAPAIAKN